jgi:hypothetical protein
MGPVTWKPKLAADQFYLGHINQCGLGKHKHHNTQHSDTQLNGTWNIDTHHDDTA